MKTFWNFYHNPPRKKTNITQTPFIRSYLRWPFLLEGWCDRWIHWHGNAPWLQEVPGGSFWEWGGSMDFYGCVYMFFNCFFSGESFAKFLEHSSMTFVERGGKKDHKGPCWHWHSACESNKYNIFSRNDRRAIYKGCQRWWFWSYFWWCLRHFVKTNNFIQIHSCYVMKLGDQWVLGSANAARAHDSCCLQGHSHVILTKVVVYQG